MELYFGEVCKHVFEGGSILARTRREKHRNGVSRSTMHLFSLHVSHGWTFISSRVDSFAFFSRSLSPVPYEISSMPSAYYVSTCVFPHLRFIPHVRINSLFVMNILSMITDLEFHARCYTKTMIVLVNRYNYRHLKNSNKKIWKIIWSVNFKVIQTDQFATNHSRCRSLLFSLVRPQQVVSSFYVRADKTYTDSSNAVKLRYHIVLHC